MDEEPDVDDTTARVQDAIASALPDQYVTRWLAIIEVVDADGTRALWSLGPEDATPWDALGMLEWARQVEQANLVSAEFDDDAG